MELQDGTLTHKYIDDITLSESISSSNVSLLQTAVDKVKDWSNKNNIKLNENKTKEMFISFKQNPAPVLPMIINSNAVERVHSFKILGVWLSDDLSWKSHVNHMHSRATPRLYYPVCQPDPRYEGQLTRMAEPIHLPVNPPRTHSRLYHHPTLRTGVQRRIGCL